MLMRLLFCVSVPVFAFGGSTYHICKGPKGANLVIFHTSLIGFGFATPISSKL